MSVHLLMLKIPQYRVNADPSCWAPPPQKKQSKRLSSYESFQRERIESCLVLDDIHSQA